MRPGTIGAMHHRAAKSDVALPVPDARVSVALHVVRASRERARHQERGDQLRCPHARIVAPVRPLGEAPRTGAVRRRGGQAAAGRGSRRPCGCRRSGRHWRLRGRCNLGSRRPARACARAGQAGRRGRARASPGPRMSRRIEAPVAPAHEVVVDHRRGGRLRLEPERAQADVGERGPSTRPDPNGNQRRPGSEARARARGRPAGRAG